MINLKLIMYKISQFTEFVLVLYSYDYCNRVKRNRKLPDIRAHGHIEDIRIIIIRMCKYKFFIYYPISRIKYNVTSKISELFLDE